LEVARSSEPNDDATWTVVLAGPAGDVNVIVHRTVTATPAQLTCHVEQPKFYPQFELVEIAPVGTRISQG
jgi:hypothetical protein